MSRGPTARELAVATRDAYESVRADRKAALIANQDGWARMIMNRIEGTVSRARIEGAIDSLLLREQQRISDLRLRSDADVQILDAIANTRC